MPWCRSCRGTLAAGSLTTADGTRIADSADSPAGPLPDQASATFDPLKPPGGRIDPRTVGPFQLTPAEREMLAG